MRKIEPTYLGDGVYATEDDRGIVLTTGTHVIAEADNVVVLEPKVWAALKKWATPQPEWCENCVFARHVHYEQDGKLIAPGCSGYAPKVGA
jgi:hypothetical protein